MSGGLGRYVDNGSNWGHYMADRVISLRINRKPLSPSSRAWSLRSGKQDFPAHKGLRISKVLRTLPKHAVMPTARASPVPFALPIPHPFFVVVFLCKEFNLSS